MMMALSTVARPLPPVRAAPLPQAAGARRYNISRIGKLPIPIPEGVQISLNGQHVAVKGSLGEMEYTVADCIGVRQTEDPPMLRFERLEDSRKASAQHGLWRALLANAVHGVSQGFARSLQLIGVGYKAALAENVLTLSLGYSHPVVFSVPRGIEVTVPSNTEIQLSGCDKAAVGQLAASLRAARPPEPYKGKGVRYAGEKVVLRAGKRSK